MVMQEVQAQTFYFTKWLEDGKRKKTVGQDEDGKDIIVTVPKEPKSAPGQLYPGEYFEGTVIEYSETSGGKGFNEQVCGIVSIRLDDDAASVVKITLDKGRLKTAFKNLSTIYLAKQGSFEGAYIRFQYDGWQEPKSDNGRPYKGFHVKHDPDKFDTVHAATSNLQDAF